MFIPLAKRVQWAVGLAAPSSTGTDDAAWSSGTLVNNLPSNALAIGGSWMQVQLIGPKGAGNTVVNGLYHSIRTTDTSSVWQPLAAPTPILFGGANAVTLAQGELKWSDKIAITMARSALHQLALNFGASSIVRYRSASSWQSWAKAAVQTADDLDRGATFVNQGSRMYGINSIMIGT